MDLKSTLLVIGGSAASFKLLNSIIRFLPTPEPALQKAWKWSNICTSLAHSSLTGAWAAFCFYRQPQMVQDLISSHSLLSHSLVAVSTGKVFAHHMTSCSYLLDSDGEGPETKGYFIHDFLDLAFNQSFKRSWEVLLHHSVVISCFSLAVTSRLYVGFAVVALLIEINSVFLHVRQLLLLAELRNRPGTEISAPQPSVTFCMTSWLNLGTFVVFRLCVTGWMSRWLAAHSEHVSGLVLGTGIVGLSLISTMNLVLLYRLLRADVFTNTQKH